MKRPVLIAAVLAALVVPVAVAARWHAAQTLGGPRFFPRPDALEYAAGAQAIAQSGRFYLQVGPLQVPPRYAPGWPILLALALRCGVPATELWRVTGILGAGLAWLLALLAAGATSALAPGENGPPAGMPQLLAGLLAGWTWALAQVAVGVGRTLLSDEPATLFSLASLVLSGLGLLGGPLGTGRRALVLSAAGGLAFGLTAAVRLVNAVLLLPPLAVIVLIAWRTAPSRAGLRSGLQCGAAWLLGAAVFPALTAWLLVHSGRPPLQWSAYALWVPEYYAHLSDTFNLRFALQPDQHFRLGRDTTPLSHLGLAARALLGLPGLRVRHYLGPVWPLFGWLAALPLLAAARRQGGAAARLAPWMAAGLLAWTLAHVVVFSLYLFPATRFYLAPLAVCTVLFAAACGLGFAWPRPAPRLAAAAASLLVLCLAVRGWRQMQDEIPPPRTDQRTWSHFARWKAKSDEERAAGAVPFDPVYAQAVGLLPPEVVDSIRSWGELPPTAHVVRMRNLGYLPPASPAATSVAVPPPLRQ